MKYRIIAVNSLLLIVGSLLILSIILLLISSLSLKLVEVKLPNTLKVNHNLIIGFNEQHLNSKILVYCTNGTPLLLGKNVLLSTTKPIKTIPLLLTIIYYSLFANSYMFSKITKHRLTLPMSKKIFLITFLISIMLLFIIPFWVDVKAGEKAYLIVEKHEVLSNNLTLIEEGRIVGKLRLILDYIVYFECAIIFILTGLFLILLGIYFQKSRRIYKAYPNYNIHIR